MRALISELLDFRKLEQGHVKLKVYEQNIVPFLKEIYLSFYEYASSRSITYLFTSEKENINCWFDPKQMQKVFYNLLSNAFKFTPKEGNITVSILRKKEFAEIRISDTGSGIPQSQQAHIFERFYQADNATGLSLSGSGIGLALTQENIMQHKGHIGVKSELGEGTTFTVTLPLGDEHLASEQKSAEPQPVDMLPVQEAKP